MKIRFDVYDFDGKLLRSASGGEVSSELGGAVHGRIYDSTPQDEYVNVIGPDGELIARFLVEEKA